MKKILFLLSFFLITRVACAQKCGVDCDYTIDSYGVLTMKGKNSASLASLPFEERMIIRKVVVSEGITSLDPMALAGLDNVEEIVLPDSLISVDYGGFSGDTHLAKIVLSDKTRLVGKWVQDHFDGVDVTKLKLYCGGVLSKCDENLDLDGYAYLKVDKHFLEMLNVRRVYTPAEASRVSKPNGNKVMIRYR